VHLAPALSGIPFSLVRRGGGLCRTCEGGAASLAKALPCGRRSTPGILGAGAFLSWREDRNWTCFLPSSVLVTGFDISRTGRRMIMMTTHFAARCRSTTCTSTVWIARGTENEQVQAVCRPVIDRRHRLARCWTSARKTCANPKQRRRFTFYRKNSSTALGYGADALRFTVQHSLMQLHINDGKRCEATAALQQARARLRSCGGYQAFGTTRNNARLTRRSQASMISSQTDRWISLTMQRVETDGNAGLRLPPGSMWQPYPTVHRDSEVRLGAPRVPRCSSAGQRRETARRTIRQSAGRSGWRTDSVHHRGTLAKIAPVTTDQIIHQ
jgi:hypothetical protein